MNQNELSALYPWYAQHAKAVNTISMITGLCIEETLAMLDIKIRPIIYSDADRELRKAVYQKPGFIALGYSMQCAA